VVCPSSPICQFFVVALAILSSCDNAVIKKWYETEIYLSGDCAITAYYFINPSGAGIISEEKSLAAEAPIPITITYPHGLSVPEKDDDIKVVYIGVEAKAEGPGKNRSPAFSPATTR
jgi:hypothetical protein